jgi:hypothetical protein
MGPHYLMQAGGVMSEEKILIAASDNRYSHVPYADLHRVAVRSETVPVGSVEFVRRYAEINDVVLPQLPTYPAALNHYLGRLVWRCRYADVPADAFCKPLRTKLFTGGIRSTITETVPDEEIVLAAESVAFDAEFRYYILDGRIIGHSRYDAGDEPAEPDPAVVQAMVRDYADAPCGYALDVGICGGKTLLVEVNDGWSIGYYRWGDMKPRAYMDLISARWQEILAEQTGAVGPKTAGSRS